MTSLYASLLGPAWESLAPTVQRLHQGGAGARGLFRVRRGEGWLARLCAAILGMPPAGEGVGVTLSVERSPPAGAQGGGERWMRVFGDRPLCTWQWSRGPLLVEALGLVQCIFRLHAEGGALVFEQVATRLGFRGFSFPWPRVLGPRVEGRSEPDREGRAARVDVRIHAPFLGLLIAYDGEVIVNDNAPPERAA